MYQMNVICALYGRHRHTNRILFTAKLPSTLYPINEVLIIKRTNTWDYNLITHRPLIIKHCETAIILLRCRKTTRKRKRQLKHWPKQAAKMLKKRIGARLQMQPNQTSPVSDWRLRRNVVLLETLSLNHKMAY